jgi:hypothetical protein
VINEFFCLKKCHHHKINMPIVNLSKLANLQPVFASEEATIKYLQDKGILLKCGMLCERCNVGNLFPSKPKFLRCDKT